MLANYLTRGKKAPFYKVLVEDKKLTSGVGMFNGSQELAGQMQLNVTAFADKDLDEVAAATNRLLAALVTSAPPRDREVEAARARARAEKRFGQAA